MSWAADTALIAYVPAPHRGYVELFRAYRGAVLYVLGEEFIEAFAPLRRHLPGNAPEDAALMVRALGIFQEVRILTEANIGEVRTFSSVVLPEEDVSHRIAEKYLGGCEVSFDERWRLRWYKDAVAVGHRPEGTEVLSLDMFERTLMHKAFAAGKRSSDWWRQIGALFVRDGELLLAAHNKHVPSEQTAYLEGDPRSNFNPGECIDASVALHAEAAVIAAAAREGISMKGGDLYVTTFPCPPCAYLISETGIRRLLYVEGYSLIVGADAIRAKDIQIVRVLMDPPP